MTDFKTALRQEIRKEIDRALGGRADKMREDIVELRKQTKALHEALEDQLRLIQSLRREASRGSALGGGDDWSPTRLRELRRRFDLSQTALAKLLGVGLNTVWLWEKGETRPRSKKVLQQVAALEKLTPERMQRKLKSVGLSEGRKKPGRKPGSGKKAGGTKKSAKKPAAPKRAKRKPAARKKAKRKVAARK